ncbi:hypothetical protein [Halobacillus litoralis]|uniref:DUF4309 domain-containing protein n=1 Tax=Halobacillus litoralis TaxID=45668 RepID=A0A410M912_9BACI|nr:hypothetical protein [Halobacillus litoralis]QAS51163.1 hypothetical protein HLI_02545 [Halobacillus litoralis]
MKKHIKAALVILSSCIVLFSCDPTTKDKMEFYQQTKSIDLSSEMIDSISIHSDKDTILATFGKPDNIEEISTPKSQYLSYDGFEFGLMESHVFRYYFNSNHQTTRKIKDGDTKEKVIEEYGRNYYEREESGLHMMGYFDKENEMNIEFGFQGNRVTAVMVESIG